MAAKTAAKTGAKGRTTPAGDALHDLLYEISFTYFRLQASAVQRGSRDLTPGQISLLRSLAREGPQTVPAIARSRPVARQPVQRMADELAALDLVTFEPNPQHRRSQLVALTSEGRRRYNRIAQAQRVWASHIAGDDVTERRLRDAARVIRRVGERMLEELGDGRGV